MGKIEENMFRGIASPSRAMDRRYEFSNVIAIPTQCPWGVFDSLIMLEPVLGLLVLETT